MLVWETDPSLRDNELRAAFAEASLAEETAAALDATDKDVAFGSRVIYERYGRLSRRPRP